MGADRTTGALVRRPEDIDLAWAHRVVSSHAPGSGVRSISVDSVDVGTTTRVRLTVDHDGPDDLPRRWFVKIPSRSWKAVAITALPRLPQTEVRFYGELAGRVPVARPRALAATKRFGRGFTLVLEDVTESGAVPGKPGDALDAASAARMVSLLGRLHASHWEAASLDAELAWLAGPVRRLEDGLGTALAVPLMRRGLGRAGDAVPRGLHAPAMRYASQRRRAQRHLAAAPRTLVHHDCHPGNLYWRGDEPGLLDWQLVRIGEGAGDLAYLLATALEPAVRREAEDALLARYADALVEHGAPRLDASALRDRFRAHLTYAFEAMVVTLAVGGLIDDPICLELVRRTAAAVADHDAFAAALET